MHALLLLVALGAEPQLHMSWDAPVQATCQCQSLGKGACTCGPNCQCAGPETVLALDPGSPLLQSGPFLTFGDEPAGYECKQYADGQHYWNDGTGWRRVRGIPQEGGLYGTRGQMFVYRQGRMYPQVARQPHGRFEVRCVNGVCQQVWVSE